MSDGKYSFYAFLEELSNEGFDSLKNSFAANYKTFVSNFESYTVFGLLSVLCEPRIRKRLTRFDFDNIIKYLVQKGPMDVLIMEYAMDLVNECVYIEKEKYKNKEVADYADHLIANLVPSLKELFHRPELSEKEIVLQLVDIFKTAACVYQYRDEDHFEFSSGDGLDVSFINHLLAFYREQWKEYEEKERSIRNNKQMFALDTTEKKAHFSYRNYSLIMSMILSLIAADQDGMLRKAEMNHVK